MNQGDEFTSVSEFNVWSGNASALGRRDVVDQLYAPRDGEHGREPGGAGKKSGKALKRGIKTSSGD